MNDRAAREALIDSLQVGDLIQHRTLVRVVRDVHKRGARVMNITLSIRRCSWTRKPYTVVGRCDLYLCDLLVVAKGYGLGSGDLVTMLQDSIADKKGAAFIDCCDVIGVID